MQDIFIILIIAVSLSMDTFSLSLAYGMLKLKNSIIKQISITVGIFHFFMPLLGDFLGEYFKYYKYKVNFNSWNSLFTTRNRTSIFLL